ncbi:MAG: hypothetical protein ACRCWE_09975 [Stenotrophomonas maltophilia]
MSQAIRSNSVAMAIDWVVDGMRQMASFAKALPFMHSEISIFSWTKLFTEEGRDVQ